MKRLIAVLVVTLPLLLWILIGSGGSKLTVVESGRTIAIEVADTSAARQKGLSDRPALGQYSGMLFAFDEPHIPGFWMKDMRFSLDIIWINSEAVVVGIESDVSPDTYPQTFSPLENISYVLEVNAGQAEALGITQGGQLEFDR